MRWRIYYGDGSTFDSTMGGPQDAPVAGFICAVGYSRHGTRFIAHGYDFYRWEPGDQVWLGIDWWGIVDRLRFGGEFIGFKEGRMVSADRFQELMNTAHRDPDFPTKGRA